MINPENKLAEIKNLIQLSSSCRGKVFGEFVRDVIVPKSSSVSCNQISIWFTSENDCKDFVFKAKISFNFLQIEKRVYALYCNATHTIFVKLFVSKYLPVNDFDVNCLTYYYYDGDFFFGREILTIKPELLIESIKNKNFLMFHNYGKNLDDNRIKKINSEYLEKGWKMRYNGSIFSERLTSESII